MQGTLPSCRPQSVRYSAFAPGLGPQQGDDVLQIVSPGRTAHQFGIAMAQPANAIAKEHCPHFGHHPGVAEPLDDRVAVLPQPGNPRWRLKQLKPLAFASVFRPVTMAFRRPNPSLAEAAELIHQGSFSESKVSSTSSPARSLKLGGRLTLIGQPQLQVRELDRSQQDLRDGLVLAAHVQNCRMTHCAAHPASADLHFHAGLGLAQEGRSQVPHDADWFERRDSHNRLPRGNGFTSPMIDQRSRFHQWALSRAKGSTPIPPGELWLPARR